MWSLARRHIGESFPFALNFPRNNAITVRIFYVQSVALENKNLYSDSQLCVDCGNVDKGNDLWLLIFRSGFDRQLPG